MEAQSVNCGVLDGLVLQYVAEEHLLEDPEDGLTTRPSPNIDRELIRVVRLLIEAGRIKEALKLMQQHGHVALEDQRLLFRLHKQVYMFCPSSIQYLLLLYTRSLVQDPVSGIVCRECCYAKASK
jgi:hypothetical protein